MTILTKDFTQFIKGLTYKLDNCVHLLLTDVPGVVHPPFSNSDSFSISFTVKLGFKIPNIFFSRKVYLKSCVDLPLVGKNLNHNWNVVYNNPNPVSELNEVTTSLIDTRVPSKVIRRKVNDKAWFKKIM